MWSWRSAGLVGVQGLDKLPTAESAQLHVGQGDAHPEVLVSFPSTPGNSQEHTAARWVAGRPASGPLRGHGSLTLSDIRATLQPEAAEALLRLGRSPWRPGRVQLPSLRPCSPTREAASERLRVHLCLCVCRSLCVSRRVHLCLCLSQAASRAVHLLVPLAPSWTSARSPDSPGAGAKLPWPPLLWP